MGPSTLPIKRVMLYTAFFVLYPGLNSNWFLDRRWNVSKNILNLFFKIIQIFDLFEKWLNIEMGLYSIVVNANLSSSLNRGLLLSLSISPEIYCF